jgi:hypothetical protein
MKKIGILTFHGAHNYGSVLQSYASVITLRKFGYDPEIINLRNQAQLDSYRIFHPGEGIVRRAFKLLIYPQLKSRFNKFEHFITHTLPISAKEYRRGEELNPDSLGYDIYYTGSDQVWNPACQDFESAYYLDFVNHRRPTVAYAPSMGKAVFDADDEQHIQGLIKYVDHLSCREQSGADLIARLSGRPVAQVCDPVLLPSREDWSAFAKAPRRKRPYILAYFLNNNHGDRSQIDVLRRLTGYDVVILNEYIRDLFKSGIKMKLDASPQEFLGLIRDAAIVYTNSFHATAFSVIFHKDFYTAVAADANVHNNNDSRKLDFLASLGLESRIVRNGTPIESLNPVNYSETDKKLALLRTKSLNYLKDALSGE